MAMVVMASAGQRSCISRPSRPLIPDRGDRQIDGVHNLPSQYAHHQRNLTTKKESVKINDEKNVGRIKR